MLHNANVIVILVSSCNARKIKKKQKGYNSFNGFSTVVAMLVHELQHFICSHSLPVTSRWVPATTKSPVLKQHASKH